MDIKINIDRFYRDKIYKEQVRTKVQRAMLLLKVERVSFNFINELAFRILDAIDHKNLNFLREFRNKKVAWGYSIDTSKCIDLILK
ncbi:hypothetical protein [Clostridium massiliodielmoense]|uniref:hypothetical protein n=1 Tax=Clostridium massiliodielmoense TaxID=1776385 RepID=UPI000A26C470|nr:hypothetical protein [Clostridium massiliodielmoense]